ncbi:MAG: hypothetical protein ACI4WX_10860 [Aristaeellaceae bacterium]
MSNVIKKSADMQDQSVDQAIEEAVADDSVSYIRVLKKPINYNGKKYDTLHFDFEKLTGQDFLDINEELTAKSIMVVSPSFSTQFQLRVACRSCKEPIGTDVFKEMTFVDAMKITNRVRNFMLASEQ